jgi:putative NADPH-quinone reductase
VRTRVVDILSLRQHKIDNLDLYAERFNPVMSRETFLHYLDPVENRKQAQFYVERLLAAEALILISPI